jgi:hypothetical protein
MSTSEAHRVADTAVDAVIAEETEIFLARQPRGAAGRLVEPRSRLQGL